MHEYATTLDDEIEMFWRRGSTGTMTYQYIANKYLNLAALLLEAIRQFVPLTEEVRISLFLIGDSAVLTYDRGKPSCSSRFESGSLHDLFKVYGRHIICASILCSSLRIMGWYASHAIVNYAC